MVYKATDVGFEVCVDSVDISEVGNRKFVSPLRSGEGKSINGPWSGRMTHIWNEQSCH